MGGGGGWDVKDRLELKPAPFVLFMTQTQNCYSSTFSSLGHEACVKFHIILDIIRDLFKMAIRSRLHSNHFASRQAGERSLLFQFSMSQRLTFILIQG